MAADDDDPEDGGFDGPSRSQRKRDAAVLKDLGDELVALPVAELDALPLDEKLRDAIDLAKRITAHGGAARQRQLIGKLLRKRDVEALRAVIAERVLERRMVARDFHRIEVWRDRLLAEGAPALAALVALEPSLDAAEMKDLIETAQREAASGRPPAAARALFRRLRDTLAPAAPTA